MIKCLGYIVQCDYWDRGNTKCHYSLDHPENGKVFDNVREALCACKSAGWETCHLGMLPAEAICPSCYVVFAEEREGKGLPVLTGLKETRPCDIPGCCWIARHEVDSDHGKVQLCLWHHKLHCEKHGDKTDNGAISQ